MKVYLIKRFDETYTFDEYDREVTSNDYTVGVCLTKERAYEVAESYLINFANKISGIIPYDDIDEEWSRCEWNDICVDIKKLEVNFSDECEFGYTVSFLIEEMEVTE